MGLLSRLIGGRRSKSGAGFDEDIPRYPPFAKGLPVANIDRLLDSQEEMTRRIRAALGFPRETFDQLVLPVLENYAAFVHLLPASESHHHRGAGGLLRHGLEVAFWATQASENVIFSMEGTPQSRRDNEPRWRLAACLSGLLHDVGKPLSDVSVTDQPGNLTWNPYYESLYAWAQRHQVERYFLRWRDSRHKRHEKFSLLAIDRLIPQDTMGYLSASDGQIIQSLLEAISGAGVNEPVTRLMLNADRQSVAQDMKQSRLDTDLHALGVPVERYVFDGIRRLIAAGTWRVNVPAARVWVLRHGVFITWKKLDDLYALFERDSIPGIPRDADTLADILIERGFAIARSLDENDQQAQYRYWPVTPRLAGMSAKTRLLMLRLESPSLAFTNELPPVVDAAVEGLDTVDDVEQDTVEGFVDLAPPEGAGTDNESAEPESSKPESSAQESSESEASEQEDAPVAPPQTDLPAVDHDDGPRRVSVRMKKSNQPHTPPQQRSAPLRPRDLDAYRVQIAQHLNPYGQAGQLMMRLLLHEDGLSPHVLRLGKTFGLVYPDALQSHGKPKDVLAQLDQAGFVLHTDTFPSKKVHDINGQKIVLFSKPLCDVLSAQPASSFLPKSNTRTVLKPDAGLSESDPEIVSADKRRHDHAQKEQQASDPASMNPAQACEALARMMRQGSGSWLVSPVTREDAYLVTSDKALERITKDHPQLPRLALSMWLKMNPILHLRDNKICLHAPEQEPTIGESS